MNCIQFIKMIFDFLLPMHTIQRTRLQHASVVIVLRRRNDAPPCEGLKREHRSHQNSTRHRSIGEMCSELKL